MNSAGSNEIERLKTLGNTKFNDKQFVDAIELYSQAIELAPDNHVLFSNRSISFNKLGRLANSVPVFFISLK
jgi:stress-induced-phosphoprotein 1